ncbi:hypothetical protein DFJ75_4965 [Williamsia muralis]|uniref:Uncharacterized protein n=2 Tax=Williamsia marianensis TaxID=85044 RepID=A0A495ITD7_WILMA|nr:hypothetical protein DFJ75_4965 [Williamsia muralis]
MIGADGYTNTDIMNSMMFLEPPRRLHTGTPRRRVRPTTASSPFTPVGGDLAILLTLPALVGTMVGLAMLTELQ